MFLENVVTDATDPHTLGRFWETVLGTEPLTDEDAGYETRYEVPGGPVLDLGFQTVPAPPTGPRRLAFGLRGVDEGLLAGHADIPFFLVHEETAYDGAGPLAALSLEVADPERERGLWAWLSGWEPTGDRGLRHPSGRGPVLELRPEEVPKTDGKNRSHLDVRLEPGDDLDALVREIEARGGRRLVTDWGDLPWQSFQDPSGNELCLLPSRGG